MIRKIQETIARHFKSWFETKENKEVQVIPVWFPATKDHRYD